MGSIIIGNDHGALELKLKLVNWLADKGHSVCDCGVNSAESVDYPDIAEECCRRFLSDGFDFGILLCGTGIGISISANKINGIRCALPQNSFAARMAKEHNNANFLAFGGRIDYPEPVETMIEAFIGSSFQGGRHQTRVDKLVRLESC
jgi:ribose 5-phosphate isomerase B